MKAKTLACYLALSIFIPFTFFMLLALGPKINSSRRSQISSVHINYANEAYAQVFIYYPIAKSGEGFSVFINRKNIAKLANGGRIECRLLLEGPVSLTMIEGNTYKEPLTQAKNSRTITIKKGKSYYFRVSGTGLLEYVFNTEKGEKGFANASEFSSPPTAFTEDPRNTIPTLATLNN